MKLGERQRGKRFLRRMLASERFEALIVERLHAERNAVDTRGTIAGEVLGLDAGRIGLERDLGVVLDVPMTPDGIEDRGDRSGPHQGRRAAAEEDAGDVTPGRERGEMRKLLQIGGEEPRLVDAAMADVAVEVAIRAFGAAERPMHIDAKWLIHFRHRPTISFSKARMRCDSAFFLAGSISPKVSL